MSRTTAQIETYPGNPFGTPSEGIYNLSPSLNTNAGAFALPAAVDVASADGPANAASTGYLYFRNNGFNQRVIKPFGLASTGTGTITVFTVRPKTCADGVLRWVSELLLSIAATYNSSAGSPNDFPTAFFASAITLSNFGIDTGAEVIGNTAKRVIFDPLGAPIIGVHLALGTATGQNAEYGSGV